MEYDEHKIGENLVDCAIKLHKSLGACLLEEVYETILSRDLEERGLKVERHVAVPIEYNGMNFDKGYTVDLMIEDKVIVEIRSLDEIENSDRKRLLTYVRLSGKKLGYILNFGEALMKDGIIRTVVGQF
jgi:GxxExxY protein